MIDLQHGDCLELLKDVSANSIDMVVTSPPYDNLRTYNDNINQWNFEKFQDIVKELYRVMTPGGVVVWVVADATLNGSETGTSFRQALYFMECGFNLHDTMIWRKDTCAFPCAVRYANVFEYMFVFSKGKPKTFNPICDRKNKRDYQCIHGTYRNADGTMTRRKCNVPVKKYGARFNVWDIITEKHNETGHPAVFPLQIAEDHIRSWSNEGDIVLDPFMGSGTSGIAAKNLNRNFIGMEIDSTYFQIAKDRIEGTLQESLPNPPAKEFDEENPLDYFF